MTLDNLNPIIHHITVNKTVQPDSPAFSFGEHTVHYFEIELILSSFGRMRIDGTDHLLAENDVFFRKPGQTAEGFMPYRYQGIFFQISDPDCCPFLNSFPDKLNFRKMPRIQALFGEIQLLFLSEAESSRLLLKARLLELLYLYYANAATSSYGPHMKRAIEFMEKNYGQNIDVSDIAASAGISVRYLFLQFREFMSETPIHYLNKLRLEKSRTLLLDTKLSVSEIAQCCGFKSHSYFDYVFKLHTGISPAAFRSQHVR